MTIPGVFTHINLLQPPPMWLNAWTRPGADGGRKGSAWSRKWGFLSAKLMMTSSLEKRTPIHHDSPYLPRRGDPGSGVWIDVRGVCVCVCVCVCVGGVVKSTLLIAVIIDFAIPAQREKEEELQFVCVWKGGKAEWVILSFLGETRLNIPRVCESVCVCVCVCVCRLSIVWQSNITLVVLWALTHPSCTPCENAGFVTILDFPSSLRCAET